MHKTPRLVVCVCLWWTYRRTLDVDKKDHSFTAMFASEGRQRNGGERQDGLYCVCATELHIDDMTGNMKTTNICGI